MTGSIKLLKKDLSIWLKEFKLSALITIHNKSWNSLPDQQLQNKLRLMSYSIDRIASRRHWMHSNSQCTHFRCLHHFDSDISQSSLFDSSTVLRMYLSYKRHWPQFLAGFYPDRTHLRNNLYWKSWNGKKDDEIGVINVEIMIHVLVQAALFHKSLALWYCVQRTFRLSWSI